MIKSNLPIYLASKSPRRRKLLQQANIDFEAFSVDVDESRAGDERPEKMVTRLSSEKLKAAKVKIKKGIIITADTIVVIDDHVLGKPSDEKDADRILNILSGRTHSVYTGFSVWNSETDEVVSDYEKTDVTFIPLSQDDIKEYIRSGSPMDKAGAYGIQDDFGAVFIKSIEGCYYNVVGLPLSRIYSVLKRITPVA